MARTVTIALAAPLVTHAGAQSRITLREPKGAEYWSIGEPSVLAKAGDGALYRIENDEAIDAYIRRCCVDPADPNLLDQLGLTDGMRVKEAVLGFFTESRAEISTPISTSS